MLIIHVIWLICISVIHKFQSFASESDNLVSLDLKRNVHDGIVSGIGTLFSLVHKLYASDYDSDSVATNNQP